MIQCDARPLCPGCPLFEATYESWRDQIADKITEITTPYPEPFEVSNWHGAPARELYRVRSRMVVTKKGLGFYGVGSRDAVTVRTCVVHHPDLEESMQNVRRFLETRNEPTLQFVDARRGESSTTITFCLTRENPVFRDAIMQHDWGADHVHLNVSNRKSAVMQGVQDPVVGDTTIQWRLGDEVFVSHPKAFFQVNPDVLQAIHRTVRPHFADSKKLLDLYCGIGVHGLSLVPDASAEIVGFDQSEDAIRSAHLNSQTRGRSDTWIAARDGAFEWSGCDVAVINPGRNGIEFHLTQKLLASDLQTIAYISCEPVTFFRDLERLREIYDLVTIDAFEMMPRTEHVEMVAILKRSDRSLAVADKSGASRWVARLAGAAPNGTPPGGAAIRVKKLRRVDDSTIVSIETSGVGERAIRKALRAWGYPVIGDPDFGDGQYNRRFQRESFLDRPLLHCVEANAQKYPIPGFLMGFFALPRKLLES